MAITPTEYTATEARKHWADIIRRVEQGEPITITRHDKVTAVLVSISTYQALQELSKLDRPEE